MRKKILNPIFVPLCVLKHISRNEVEKDQEKTQCGYERCEILETVGSVGVSHRIFEKSKT